MLQLPCGQCIGCRMLKSQMWATRCVHEASQHNQNCFVTLTYHDKHLPWDGSLNKTHFQNFAKRLRKSVDYKIRYFMCGEYGAKLNRPHYHALLFGHDFDDKTLWTSKDGINTFTSERLEALWPFGFSTVGDITWESAAYCSRYTTKKITGKDAENHYWRQTFTDLEVQLEPEYANMSLKPGIGATWFEKYKRDCFPSDFITHGGKKHRIPRYYDQLAEQHNEIDLATIKGNRRRKAEEWHHECTPKRLAAREACATARLDLLKRNLES